MGQSEYTDTLHCGHCDMDTVQVVRPDTHERDSSQHYQCCLTCFWWKLGMSKQWHPPLEHQH